jgi:hypothetical protein
MGIYEHIKRPAISFINGSTSWAVKQLSDIANLVSPLRMAPVVGFTHGGRMPWWAGG